MRPSAERPPAVPPRLFSRGVGRSGCVTQESCSNLNLLEALTAPPRAQGVHHLVERAVWELMANAEAARAAGARGSAGRQPIPLPRGGSSLAAPRRSLPSLARTRRRPHERAALLRHLQRRLRLGRAAVFPLLPAGEDLTRKDSLRKPRD